MAATHAVVEQEHGCCLGKCDVHFRETLTFVDSPYKTSRQGYVLKEGKMNTVELNMNCCNGIFLRSALSSNKEIRAGGALKCSLSTKMLQKLNFCERAMWEQRFILRYVHFKSLSAGKKKFAKLLTFFARRYCKFSEKREDKRHVLLGLCTRMNFVLLYMDSEAAQSEQ